MPIYRFTAERARLESPTVETQRLLGALVSNPRHRQRFLGLT